MGDGDGDCKEISILNRLAVWVGRRLVYTAHSKHRRVVMEELGLQPGQSKSLSMPISKETLEEVQAEGEELSPLEGSYRIHHSRIVLPPTMPPTCLHFDVKIERCTSR